MELKSVTKNARIEKEASPQVRECLESRILEIFTCGIRNPGLWNSKFCYKRNLKSHERLESGIHVHLIKNPESSAWSPKFKNA